MARAEILEGVLNYIVRSIADEPDGVSVTLIEQGPDEILAEVRAAKRDMGRVIGRRGRVARAIRMVAQVAAEEEGIAAHVEIVD